MDARPDPKHRILRDNVAETIVDDRLVGGTSILGGRSHENPLFGLLGLLSLLGGHSEERDLCGPNCNHRPHHQSNDGKYHDDGNNARNLLSSFSLTFLLSEDGEHPLIGRHTQKLYHKAATLKDSASSKDCQS
ncbi:MAG TPA: hypothetical protein VHL31_11465 [Geminicoccus sp.]|uniref:hypothetical protein n=1 Tax=Geminicoccus sp. TaxID=2024832 RepID=UPI002E2EC8D5|nr:hypothetical protein [Geminicoccus sp.]HEX2526897.1 hypothetical protein [Geminicoccus sp.]